MNLVRHVAEVRSRIGEAKAVPGAFGSNLYLADDALEALIAREGLYVVSTPGAVVFRSAGELLDRIYYAAASPDALRSALAALPAPDANRYVVDLLGRAETNAPWRECFAAAGFARYGGFLRMQRPIPPGMAAVEINPVIEDAREDDAPAIAALLQEHFDLYAEHLPDVAHLRRAAADGTVLVVRDGERLAAYFIYDRSGLTTNFRYWSVLPEYRSLGYGDLLMKRYFQKCADCRRSLLWVRDTNTPAIRIYRWYGYKPDLTIDEVFVMHCHG